MKPALAPRSFRVRLMLLFVTLSAAILLGFGGRAWHLLNNLTGLKQLDDDMRALARNQLASPRRGGDWPAFEDTLNYMSELDPSRSFAFFVVGRQGEERLRSASWPGDIDPGRILARIALDRAFPPEPEGFQRGDGGFRRGGDGPRFDRPDRRDGDQRPGGPQGPPEGANRPAPPPPPSGGPVPTPDALNPPPVFPPQPPIPGPGDGRGPVERLEVREVTFLTIHQGKYDWRLAVFASHRDLLVVGADLTPYFAEFNALRQDFLLLLALALVAIGAGGWFLAARALRPVHALIGAAESITAQDLARRLPESGASAEYDRLNRVFNEMLERLDRSFKQATRFSADAAHELKTPLTILQGQLNQALQEVPPGSPLQQKIGGLLEEVQRLSVIIRRLLLLSLADAGQLKLTLAPLRLDTLLESILEDVEILAPALDVKGEIEGAVSVEADAALLQQAIQNLANNAIKYNVPQGKIRFALFRQDGHVRLTVANTSAGIAEEDRKRVFHRFYRGDPAHSRAVDGLGLGLSLAREIVRAHGGKLWLGDAPDGWVLFVMELPASPRG